MKIEEVISDLDGVVVKENVDLSKVSYSRTGGFVRYYLLPLSENAASNLFTTLQKGLISYKVIGNMTNIIFLDIVEYNCFVDLKLLSSYSFIDSKSIYVESGRNMFDLCRDVSAKKLSGLEGLEGIPGTLGGALAMNAGAYGYMISDHVVKVRVYSKVFLKMQWLTAKECLFSHRESIFINGDYIILGAKFSLYKSSVKTIQKSMEMYHIARHTYQDFTLPNLGSIFYFHEKNIYEEIYENTSGIKKKLFYFLKKTWTSRITKHIRRSHPNNKILNYFVLNYLGFKVNDKLVSSKTLNTFLNPNVTTLEICLHIQALKRNMSDNVQLENEIFTDVIYKVINNEVYLKILDIKKDIDKKNENQYT
jgi:UDP-N-acetylmuramate dehydrogenase